MCICVYIHDYNAKKTKIQQHSAVGTRVPLQE